MSHWTLLGLLGQALFFSRMLVQWVVSERLGRSVVPPAFWVLSLLGSTLLLAYAVHLRDPVFTLGQSVGFVVYVRNLVLIRRGAQARGGLDPTC